MHTVYFPASIYQYIRNLKPHLTWKGILFLLVTRTSEPKTSEPRNLHHHIHPTQQLSLFSLKMDPPSKPLQSYILSLLFAIGALGLLVEFIQLFTQANGISSLPHLLTQPYFIAEVTDVTLGICFALLYFFTRNDSLSYTSATLLVILTLILGNIPLFIYIAYLTITSSTPTHAILPYSDHVCGYHQLPPFTSRAKRSYVYWWTALILFLALTITNIWALRTQSFSKGFALIKDNHLMFYEFSQLLDGCVFVIVYIVLREGGINLTSILWTVAVLLLGNMTTCIYVMHVATQAGKTDLPFDKVFLSRRNH